jgi:23S rRNA pseudouridine2605 synthase
MVAALRLNQAIAKTGYCSRRDADKLIAEGRVSVNGELVRDFSRAVDPDHDELAIDGNPLNIHDFLYVAMYKPRGIVTTTSDEQGRTTVLDLLPVRLRHLRPVGRLDMHSEGLILITNDGDLTQKVTHPVHHLPKTYIVTVRGDLTNRDLKLMSRGILLDDGITLPANTRLINRDSTSTTFELTIREGRNRQIRRMCEQLGFNVSRLVRVSIGELQLGQMTPGSWRYLTSVELRQLERR